MKAKRRRRRHALPYANPAPDAALTPQYGPSRLVLDQCLLAHGAGIHADTARRTRKRDTAFRNELDRPQTVAGPPRLRKRQRTRRTGRYAGHVGTRDTRLDRGLQRGRTRRQTARGRHRAYRPGRTHRCAGTAPGAGREETDLGQRTWRTDIALLHHAILGPLDQVFDPAIQTIAQDLPAIGRAIVVPDTHGRKCGKTPAVIRSISPAKMRGILGLSGPSSAGLRGSPDGAVLNAAIMPAFRTGSI